MAADIYTHDFIYRLGDGGQFIKGEIEFNHDKKVSFRIKKWSEPLPQELLTAFNEFIERLKLRFDQWEGIKYIVIKEKGYVEPDEVV